MVGVDMWRRVVVEPPPENGLYFLTFPDDATARRIAGLAHRCRREYGLRAPPLLSWRFHVSLHNVGQYGASGVPGTVVLKASNAAAKVKASPFAVMFNRVESFSGRDGHYPLVLRGDDGVVGLEMLNRSLGVSMRMVGLKASLNFTPHVTLSYGERPVEERLIQPIRWTVREFALIHSLIRKTKYIRLGCWSLGA
jgi:RNA 2',3'-cyclic 3'-phosphodiesterase